MDSPARLHEVLQVMAVEASIAAAEPVLEAIKMFTVQWRRSIREVQEPAPETGEWYHVIPQIEQQLFYAYC